MMDIGLLDGALELSLLEKTKVTKGRKLLV